MRVAEPVQQFLLHPGQQQQNIILVGCASLHPPYMRFFEMASSALDTAAPEARKTPSGVIPAQTQIQNR
jgi:hypothetical protein